ncbi:MAG: sulfatase [Myxococcota bacterium]|nr:sulfatase [Myxococcota bacterium]
MSRATHTLRLGLAAAFLLLGCTPETPTGSPSDRPNSIVLYVIDTLRADHLGAYGHSERVSPRLDALAEESVVFERSYAPAPWTLPSVVSILTSRPACEHQVWVDEERLSETIPTWAERLGEAGFATANFHANPYAGRPSGLDRGFDVVELAAELDAERIGRWLDEVEERPFFLYLHAIEPHDPYKPRATAPEGTSTDAVPRPETPPPDRVRRINKSLGRFRSLTRAGWARGLPPESVDNSRLQGALLDRFAEEEDEIRALYDADIRVADDAVARILDLLESRGRLDDTVLAVTSDHGEEFGEHDGWAHDQSLYEELIRVPLLIRLPEGQEGGRRVSVPVSGVDLMPTLAAAAGIDGASSGFLALSRGDATGETSAPVVALRQNEKKFYRPHREARGDRNVAWIEGDWKAIWNRDVERVELYDLGSDPGERDDRADAEPERAAAAREQAEAWLARCEQRAAAPARGVVDDEEREQLKALGYID